MPSPNAIACQLPQKWNPMFLFSRLLSPACESVSVSGARNRFADNIATVILLLFLFLFSILPSVIFLAVCIFFTYRSRFWQERKAQRGNVHSIYFMPSTLTKLWNYETYPRTLHNSQRQTIYIFRLPERRPMTDIKIKFQRFFVSLTK